MKALLTTLVSFIFILSSSAQSVVPDQSFGEAGLVIDINHPATMPHIALQPDGKLVAAGTTTGSGKSGFLVVRYNPDGSPDTTFGNKGSVSTCFSADSLDVCRAVSLQPDGRIVAAGSTFSYAAGYNHIAVACYKPDGSLDPSFGKAGLVNFSIAPQTKAFTTDMALQPDGKIVITGKSTATFGQPHTPFVVRFNTDGTPDAGFGSGGEVFAADADLELSSVLVQPDGRIVLGGTNPFISTASFFVLRYLSNGTPDKSFGAKGEVKQTFNPEYSFAELSSLALQKDGSLVCGGNEQVPGTTYAMNAALIRLTGSGALDSSFGNGGKVITVLAATSEINSLAIQSDGKIIGAGTLNPGSDNASFATLRYLPDGSVDSSFDADGLVVTNVANGVSCSDALLQENGKIVLAGTGYNLLADNNVFVFARYNNTGLTHPVIVTRIKRWLNHHGISWTPDNGVRYYNVQRSRDGGITYESVAKIYNSNQPVSTYEEAAASSGINTCYRVAAMGRNGAGTYSNAIVINESSQVFIFPNPVRGTLQLQGLPANSRSRISVLDVYGNIRTTATADGGSCSMNTAGLAPGRYLLKIQHENVVTTQPFVKE